MKQAEALEILKLGHNVFLTGAAGSGKTYLLNQYISSLREREVVVGITASTGIAATHMNGRTIHSWAGLGIKDDFGASDISLLLRKPDMQHQFNVSKVLIIDEISMLHHFRLDFVDQVCRAFKNPDLPFGGLQVILCGDFFQLPPVSKGADVSHFAPKSKVWKQMDIKVCYLTEQYRQQDQAFLNVLTDVRENDIKERTLRALKKRLNAKLKNSKIKPTKLYTHNANVDVINISELDKLQGKPKTYNMREQGKEKLVAGLKKGCMAPEELALKKGAIVMFVKNDLGRKYVNGTLGKVTGFDKDGWPIAKTIKGHRVVAFPESWDVRVGREVVAQISQVPLRLAWAITVHKSQGMSMDIAEMDLSKSFEPGMGYVALSRVRSLEGIKLLGINETALKVSTEALRLDKLLRKSSEETLSYLNGLGEEKETLQRRYLESITPAEPEEELSAVEKLKKALFG